MKKRCEYCRNQAYSEFYYGWCAFYWSSRASELMDYVSPAETCETYNPIDNNDLKEEE